MEFNELITKNLHKQLDVFIGNLQNYNKKREFPRPEKDYVFLKDFYERLFSDRNIRAGEVTSPEYEAIKQIANKQFPATTLWNLCMDGRVLAVLINGASAGVGSSVRVPGGILREFVYAENGKLTLLEDSNFAFIMKRALTKFNTKKIFEVYDSHVACAARKAEEISHGYLPNDAGLLADVMYKKEMAEATADFVKNHLSSDVNIVPIQISFDPHLGTMYMGLETKDALKYGKGNGGEYTEDVLEALVKTNKILYTGELIKDVNIKTVFAKYKFMLDWKKKYVMSAKNFWTNFESFKSELIPLITSRLLSVYLTLNDSIDGKQELEERALLLLTNTYSVFLHQYVAEENNLSKDHAYPYGDHREEGVKVYEGGYPPFEISMFVLFSLDVKNLPANIELAAGLVRNNRREKRVIDRSGVYSDENEFASAPVPVVVQEIIRESVTAKEWQILNALDWKDLPKNWDTIDEVDFYDYLQNKANFSLAVANGINNLRKRMAVLFDHDQPTSAHLIEHYKIAIPLIAGSNRYNYFIVPFIKLGFDL